MCVARVKIDEWDHLDNGLILAQVVIALLSGDAECYGIVSGSSAGLGNIRVLMDMGCNWRLVVCIDVQHSRAWHRRRARQSVPHRSEPVLGASDKLGAAQWSSRGGRYAEFRRHTD